MTRPRSISNEFEFRGDLEGEPGPRRYLLEQVDDRRSSAPAKRPDTRRNRSSAALCCAASGWSFAMTDNELLLERHQRLEIGEIRRPEHHHQIDLVSRERRHRPFVVDDLQIERHERMGFAEFGDLARQKIERQRLAAGDPHRAAPQALANPRSAISSARLRRSGRADSGRTLRRPPSAARRAAAGRTRACRVRPRDRRCGG